MAEFEQAHADFMKQLSDDEKGQFLQVNTSEDLLQGLQKLERFSKNHKKWTKLCNAVRKCSDKLDPYFAVVSITVQSHPEWAAIAWGAFRLVLLLASNYGTFFDKLNDLFDQLSSKIPAYESISETSESIKESFQKVAGTVKSFRSTPSVGISDQFKKSLRAFYVDLFQIFQSIARVFTNKNGKLKKTPIVIAQLLWQPFDVRYANLLQRLDRHNEALKLELDLMTFKMQAHIARLLDGLTTLPNDEAKEIIDSYPTLTSILARTTDIESQLLSSLKDHENLANKMNEMFEMANKERFHARIQSWLRPSPFMEVFERLSSVRQEGTAEWIFETDLYRSWLQLTSDASKGQELINYLWVRGIPGTGKSVLSTSVIRTLRDDTDASASLRSLVTFFMFEYNAKDGRPAPRDYAYRAILAQLFESVQDDNEVLELFSFALTRRRNGQQTATTSELVDLLRMLASRIDRWYLVIDGVDECEEADDLVLDLETAFGDQPTKVILFSRPNVRSLRHQMRPTQILTVSRSLNEGDLRLYFDAHLKKFQILGILSSSVPRETLVNCLVTGANGMFQWARLMINHLQSDGLIPWQRLNIIRQLKTPEKLEDMYIRILRHLTRKLTSEQVMARKIFLWITFSRTSLTTKQLEDILTPRRESSLGSVKELQCHSEEDRFPDFEHNVIMVSGSLVEKRWCAHTQATIYSFIHVSALEFFESKCKVADSLCGSKIGTMEYFTPAVREAECDLTQYCLSYIFSRVPGKPLSGSMFEAVSRATLSDLLPFLSYAAFQWPHHLASMGTAIEGQPSPNIAGFEHSVDELLTEIGQFLLNKLLPMAWVEVIYTFEKETKTHDALHETLLQWAETTNTWHLPTLSDKAREVPAAVAAFAEDLAHMHQLWGDTLQVGPHHIWQDVTGFTQSPFFVTTSAISLKSLTVESSSRSAAGTVPLSKISRDDPNTDLLAILTIWPSKMFQNIWENPTSSRKRSGKASQYDGWVAQCELWDVNADEPIVVEDCRIPLDKDEVQVQYERFKKRVRNLDGPLTAKSTRKELALHFPSSIESDLRTISVLRTVFRRQLPLPKGSSESAKAGVGIWRPLLVPIRHTPHATLLLGLPPVTNSREQVKDLPSPGSLPRALRLSRTPAFRLLTHGNFILYQSVEGRDGMSEEEDSAGTIAAYEAIQHGDVDNIRLLGCIEGDGSRGGIIRCVFHPNLPLLAFHYISRTGLSRIFLWYFAKRLSDEKDKIVLINHELLHGTLTGGFSLSCIASVNGRLKYLHFSACGTNVIYQPYQSPNPHIRSITDTAVYNMAVEASTRGSVVDLFPSHDSKQHISTLMKINALPSAMTLEQPVMHADGSSTTLSFNHSAAHRDVKLVHYEEGVEEDQSLLSLPAWDDVKHVSVSMRMPDAKREDIVTFILNKTAQPFYFLGSGGEQTAPSIVRKDIRAIGKKKIVDHLEYRDRSTGWRGITCEDKRSGDEKEHRQKRTRLN